MVFLLRQEKNLLAVTLAMDGRKTSFEEKVKDSINSVVVAIITQ